MATVTTSPITGDNASNISEPRVDHVTVTDPVVYRFPDGRVLRCTEYSTGIVKKEGVFPPDYAEAPKAPKRLL